MTSASANPLPFAFQIEEIRGEDLLVGDSPAGSHDRRNTSARRFHPAHPDAQEVLSRIPRLACDKRRLDTAALQKGLELSDGHVKYIHDTDGHIQHWCGIFTPEGGQDMAHVNTAMGRQLQEAADRLRLSRARVAKMAGVSRRHVIFAYQGGNVTVAILARLMRALALTQIEIGDQEAITDSGEWVGTTAVQETIDRIERRLATFVQEVDAELAALRAVTKPRKAPNSSAGKRAAQLVREVTANARRAGSTPTARSIQTELARAVDRTEDAEPPVRKRR